jgi:hypothetical protein
MVTTEAQAPGGTTFIQRWLARLAFVAAAAALLVPPLSAGAHHSLALTLFGVAGPLLTAAAVWWALAYKGPVRWLAITLAVAVPLGVLALYTSYRQVRYVVLSLGLLGLALAAGRAALRRDAIPERMREHQVLPPRRPFLIMNPRSGGGKVTRFGLKDKAEPSAPPSPCWTGPARWTWPPWPARRWPTGPTCWGWPAGMAPRPWSPASPPNTTCPCWSSRPAPATTSPSTWAWTARIPRAVWTPSRMGSSSGST